MSGCQLIQSHVTLAARAPPQDRTAADAMVNKLGRPAPPLPPGVESCCATSRRNEPYRGRISGQWLAIAVGWQGRGLVVANNGTRRGGEEPMAVVTDRKWEGRGWWTDMTVEEEVSDDRSLAVTARQRGSLTMRRLRAARCMPRHHH